MYALCARAAAMATPSRECSGKRHACSTGEWPKRCTWCATGRFVHCTCTVATWGTAGACCLVQAAPHSTDSWPGVLQRTKALSASAVSRLLGSRCTRRLMNSRWNAASCAELEKASRGPTACIGCEAVWRGQHEAAQPMNIWEGRKHGAVGLDLRLLQYVSPPSADRLYIKKSKHTAGQQGGDRLVAAAECETGLSTTPACNPRPEPRVPRTLRGSPPACRWPASSAAASTLVRAATDSRHWRAKGAAERAVLVLRKSPERWRRAAAGTRKQDMCPIIAASCSSPAVLACSWAQQCRSPSSSWVSQRIVPRAPVPSLAAQPSRWEQVHQRVHRHRRSKLA